MFLADESCELFYAFNHFESFNLTRSIYKQNKDFNYTPIRDTFFVYDRENHNLTLLPQDDPEVFSLLREIVLSSILTRCYMVVRVGCDLQGYIHDLSPLHIEGTLKPNLLMRTSLFNILPPNEPYFILTNSESPISTLIFFNPIKDNPYLLTFTKESSFNYIPRTNEWINTSPGTDGIKIISPTIFDHRNTITGKFCTICNLPHIGTHCLVCKNPHSISITIHEYMLNQDGDILWTLKDYTDINNLNHSLIVYSKAKGSLMLMYDCSYYSQYFILST
jgi:hypothetical protein